MKIGGSVYLGIMAFFLAMACNPIDGYEFVTRLIGIIGFLIMADERWYI